MAEDSSPDRVRRLRRQHNRRVIEKRTWVSYTRLDNGVVSEDLLRFGEDEPYVAGPQAPSANES